MTKVVNKRRENLGAVMPEGYVYIGRPSRWGNPFQIGRDGDRAEVIRKYTRWLLEAADEDARWVLANAHTLKGKALVCWCKPEACHGDVLALLAEHSYEELDDEA